MLARCTLLLAFCLIHLAAVPAFADPPDSNTFYRLSTKYRGGNIALDVFNGGPKDNFLHLVPKQTVSGQLWRFEANGDGSYKLTTQFRGPAKCLDVANGGDNNNEPYIKDCGNFSGQRWVLDQDGPWVRLKTHFRGNDTCLDIFNGGPKDGQPYFKACGAFSGQKWQLQAVQPVKRQVVHFVCRWDGRAPLCGGSCSAGWSVEASARTESEAKRITWIMPEGGMPAFGEPCAPFTLKALCCRYQ